MILIVVMNFESGWVIRFDVCLLDWHDKPKIKMCARVINLNFLLFLLTLGKIQQWQDELLIPFSYFLLPLENLEMWMVTCLEKFSKQMAKQILRTGPTQI